MANYRYLGYGITDENGIAKLDHDAQGNPIDHSYTGTGAGELDIIASLDDSTKISESSIQSGTYATLDCIQYDSGITGSVNQNWKNTSALTSATSNSNGTTFVNNNASTVIAYFNKQGSSTAEFDWEYPLRVEFDCVEKTGITYWQFRSTGSANAPNLNNYNTGKYRMDIIESSMKFYVDDQLITSYNYDNTAFAIRLVLNSNASIIFKDFKVYPI